MTTQPHYTRFHPKWHRRRVSVWWWLEQWTFTMFVLREFSSVSVGYFAVILLFQLRALRLGPEAYADFLGLMKSPLFAVFNGIALVFVTYHALTWFHLTPKALVVRLGGKRVPDSLILALNYAAWIALSVSVVLIMRG